MASYPEKGTMYPTIAPQAGAGAGAADGGYAQPPKYAIHRADGPHATPPANPYVYMQEARGGSKCWHGVPVSPERKRKNRIANAIAAVFVACWCITWPCHGPCCCGL